MYYDLLRKSVEFLQELRLLMCDDLSFDCKCKMQDKQSFCKVRCICFSYVSCVPLWLLDILIGPEC